MDILDKLRSPLRLWLGSAARREAKAEIEALRRAVALHEQNATIMQREVEALRAKVIKLEEQAQ